MSNFRKRIYWIEILKEKKYISKSNKIMIDMAQKCTYNDMVTNLTRILNSTSYGAKKLNSMLYPSSLDYLNRNTFISWSNVNQAIRWYSAIIQTNASKISKYLKYKELVERSFLSENYDLAKKYVEKIDREVGLSSWAIEKKFLIVEYMDGFENNRMYLAELSKTDTHPLNKFFFEHNSFKAERNSTYNQYIHKTRNIFEDLNSDFSNYLSYKLKLPFSYDYSTVLSIFNNESGSSLIDIFEVWIDSVQMLSMISIDEDKQLINELLKILENLSDLIDDIRIDSVITFLSGKVKRIDSTLIQYLNIFEKYTIGEYQAVVNETKEIINGGNNNFEIYELFTKSLLLLGIDAKYYIEENLSIGEIKKTLISNMYSAYSRDSNALHGFNSLRKLKLQLSSFKLSYAIDAFINRRYLRSNVIKNRNEIFRFLNQNYYDPRFVNILSEYNREIYINSEIFINSQKTVKTINCLCDLRYSSCDYSNIRESRYFFSKLIRCNEILDAIKVGERLIEILQEKKLSNINLYWYHFELISVDLFKLYLELEDLKKALSILIENYVVNELLVIRMDIKPLMNAIIIEIKKNRNSELKSMIELSILAKLVYGKNWDRVYSYCANFLKSHNVLLPSELITKNISIDSRKLMFFLKDVCTIEVLDSIRSLNTLEKVKSERIRICQHLKTVDIENKELYETEIVFLSRQVEISDSIRQINEKRIDLELDALKEKNLELFNQNFKRYDEMRMFDNSFMIYDINANDIKMVHYSKKENSGLVDERLKVLKELFVSIRDEFAFSQFGLDASLSTRIRHGQLKNYMRNKFEKYNLVSSKSKSNSEKYNVNRHWKVVFDEQDTKFSNFLQHELYEFSSKIDEKINEINDVWMQIKTETKNTYGLFDLSFSSSELNVYHAKHREISEVNELYDIIIGILMLKTRKSIEVVRNKIETDVVSYFNDCFSSLEMNIKSYGNYRNIDGINNLFEIITKCRTDVQHGTVEIIKWFSISDDCINNDFSVQHLYDTSIEITRNLYPTFNIDVKHINSNIRFDRLIRGKYFIHFIDILKIIIGNIFDHNKYNMSVEELEIEFEVTDINGKLQLIVQNRLSFEADFEELSNQLVETKKLLNNNEYIINKSIQEKGSGYPKIKRILTYFIGSSCSIVPFIKDGKFCVVLEIGDLNCFV